MIRSFTVVLYIMVLVVSISTISLVPMGPGFQAIGIGPTEVGLCRAVLTAVAVREVYVTSYGLWQATRRQIWRWRRARRAKLKPPNEELVALAERMFPDPPADKALVWAEALVRAVVKRSVRGLFSLLPESTCVALFRSLRWPLGPRCIYCGGQHLRVKDPHYRKHWRRFTCLDCSAAKGEEVTFTDLSGTILEGSHLEVRLWFWGGMLFVMGCSTLELANELGVNYKTARRMVSLFQLAYLTQRFRFLLAGPVEIDEIYIIGGLKGKAGGLSLHRPPRRRGLKKRGRGIWDSDKVPVLGLVDRNGHVYLIPCANVQQQTIQPFIERLVARGATVYTDDYSIYCFLRRLGYRHASVNHKRGEYARGEVHINGVEGLWSLLRHHLSVHRGVSKVYLPLYIVRFEFTFNRRHETRWGQLVDLLALGCQADGRHLRCLIREGRLRQACPIPGLVTD